MSLDTNGDTNAAINSLAWVYQNLSAIPGNQDRAPLHSQQTDVTAGFPFEGNMDGPVGETERMCSQNFKCKLEDDS